MVINTVWNAPNERYNYGFNANLTVNDTPVATTLDIGLIAPGSIYKLYFCGSFGTPSGNISTVNTTLPVRLYLRRKAFPFTALSDNMTLQFKYNTEACFNAQLTVPFSYALNSPRSNYASLTIDLTNIYQNSPLFAQVGLKVIQVNLNKLSARQSCMDNNKPLNYLTVMKASTGGD
jgi:hypothetical protein